MVCFSIIIVNTMHKGDNKDDDDDDDDNEEEKEKNAIKGIRGLLEKYPTVFFYANT